MKNLREAMPEIAEFIDCLREAFGKDMVNQQIRKGLKGEAVFYARENGIEIGTQSTQGEMVVYHPVTGCAIDLADLIAEREAASLKEFEQMQETRELPGKNFLSGLSTHV